MASSVNGATYAPTEIINPFMLYRTRFGALWIMEGIFLSNDRRKGISNSSSGFTETSPLNVAHPAAAVFSCDEPVHSRASSSPYRLPLATHGTVNSQTLEEVEFFIHAWRSFFVIFSSSAINPARYMASALPVA